MRSLGLVDIAEKFGASGVEQVVILKVVAEFIHFGQSGAGPVT